VADRQLLSRRSFRVELEASGWLERRTEPNGDTSWCWTPTAETALNLSALTDVTGREN
jgi:hypothetical protein